MNQFRKRANLRNGKKVKFIELQKPSFLEGLLQLPLCRERILIEQTDALTQIICQLHSAKDYLDKRFQTKESFDHCSDDFLLKAFILHNKLTILLHNNHLVQICIDVVLIGFANNSFCSSASKFGIQLLEIEYYNEKKIFFCWEINVPNCSLLPASYRKYEMCCYCF